MKDLYRCLSDHPLPLRQAIAAAWNTGTALGKGLDDVRALTEAILASDDAARVVASLSEGAREALATLIREGGALPAHRLRGYGSLLRLGPARLARERPWLTPANPLEELYYKGFVYRAYGSSTAASFGEIVLIPDELRALVVGLLPAQDVAPGLASLPSVPREAPADDALCEDALAVLVRLRRGTISAMDPQPDPTQPGYDPAALDLGPRLLGPREPERLALLRQLLWRLRLVRQTARGLQPSLRARDWLRLGDLRRQRAIYVAWRDDPHWNELFLLPGLAFGEEERLARPLPVARRNLLAVLAETPPGAWITLEDLRTLLKRVRPDYLRTDGDFDSAFARRVPSGEYATGFEQWDDVEGALATHLVTRSLYWLGVVDLGLSLAGEVLACRISARGRLLLDEHVADAEAAREDAPAATVVTGDESLDVTIPVAGTMYDRYRLERFAEWISQSDLAHYRVTPESVWYSQDADIRIEQIVNFLRRLCRGTLDPAAQMALQAWGGRYGRAFLRRVVLLETADEATMQEILAVRGVRALLGPAVSARARLVNEKQVDALVHLLKKMGIWAHVRLG